MPELARGKIEDRPWGQTFGRLAARGLTGQLTIYADGKAYAVAFTRGAVVGAASPLANDSAVRIALTGHLVTSTQVSEITRRIAASPSRDEVDVIAEIARLAPEHVQRLRRRAVAQRAARTFSLERGEFVVEDRVTVPVVAGGELDVRAVIYLGARGNLSDARLAAELDQLGSWFKLKQDAIADLPQYGFSELEKPVLARLVQGGTLAELAVEDPQLDNRAIRAIVYALASFGALETTPPPGVSRTQTRPSSVPPPPAQRGKLPTDLPTFHHRAPTPPPVSRAPSQGDTPGVGRTPTPRPGSVPGMTIRSGSGTAAPPNAMPRASSPTATPANPMPRASSPTVTPANPMPRASSPTAAPANAGRSGSFSSAPTTVPGRAPDPAAAAQARVRRTSGATTETEKLITAMTPMLERNADHFELLGVTFDAPTDQVREAYFSLARKLHPDRLASLGISDAARQAQRLFAQINTAFSTLTDPQRRREYVELQKRGGDAAVKAEENKAEELATRVMRAEEAFRQGEMALRREQYAQAITAFQTAYELQPKEPEYQALLAWAKFAGAPDKPAIAAETRTALQRAADESQSSVTARYYLGRVERMLGREKEALAHFQGVLLEKPHHAEAASEARILEQRLKSRR